MQKKKNRVGARVTWLAMLSIAAAALFLAAPSAAEPEGSAARKAGRGLAAITCGFLEVPGNIVRMTRERGPGWGFTLGFAEGLGRLVVRELVGVYELVSSPFEVPEGYVPIIEPEFPWDYFDDA